MGFSRQQYWSGLPFPPPGDLPNLGMEPRSPAFAGRFFAYSAMREAHNMFTSCSKIIQCRKFRKQIPKPYSAYYELIKESFRVPSAIFSPSSQESFCRICIGLGCAFRIYEYLQTIKRSSEKLSNGCSFQV